MKDYVASALNHAFYHCYMQDRANAAMQMSEPRYRPLTVELAQAINQYGYGDEKLLEMVKQVV